jgi:hypothetical protein
MNMKITTETLKETRDFFRNLISDSFSIKDYLNKQESTVLSQYVPSMESVTVLTNSPIDDELIQNLYKLK